MLPLLIGPNALAKLRGQDEASQMMDRARVTPSPEDGSYDARGQYQFEVPFRKEGMAPVYEGHEATTLEKLIQHPEVAKLLSSVGLMNMPVKMFAGEGATENSYFSPKDKEIGISGSTRAKVHRALAHEVQHALQEGEAPEWSSGRVAGLEALGRGGVIGDFGRVRKEDFPYIGGLMARLSTGDPTQQTVLPEITEKAISSLVESGGFAHGLEKHLRYLSSQKEAQARQAAFRDSAMPDAEQRSTIPSLLRAIPQETRWLQGR